MKRKGEGLLALDPRTQMGLVITTTLVAFVPKPFWLEAATVVWLALLQALCGILGWPSAILRVLLR